MGRLKRGYKQSEKIYIFFRRTEFSMCGLYCEILTINVVLTLFCGVTSLQPPQRKLKYLASINKYSAGKTWINFRRSQKIKYNLHKRIMPRVFAQHVFGAPSIKQLVNNRSRDVTFTSGKSCLDYIYIIRWITGKKNYRKAYCYNFNYIYMHFIFVL